MCVLSKPAAVLAAFAAVAFGQQVPYLNPSLPIDQRVDDLVSQMTMEEKATQLVNTAEAIPRLHVPAYQWWSEALHGVARQGRATVFPQVIGLAATFDAPLIKEMATVTSIEARAKFNSDPREAAPNGRALGLDFWAPNINIFRDPRWGRGQETYGEDPFLTAHMGMAYVSGMQGDDPRYFRTIATPKHFAVHSGPEATRHNVDVKVSLHDIEDTYLPAFRAAIVDAKADSVMCAYNSINGQPACVNTFLLDDTLRGAWKFNGYVVSDCGAISDISNAEPRGHGFVPTLPEAAALSLKRGADNDCGSRDAPAYLAAMQKGLISQQEVDFNLKRIFKARFQLGLFDPPSMVKYTPIAATENDSEAHRQLARKVARESMVLLKNDGTLPLKAGVRNIAVVGPLADSIAVLEGNYNGTASRYVTVIDGLRKQFHAATVSFTPGTPFMRTPVVIPESALRTDEGKPGLAGAYFKSPDLSGSPVVTRVDPQLGTPAGAMVFRRLPEEVGAGDYSARWTGTVTPPDSGTYKLAMTGVGGVRVWLDGKQIIDDWQQRAATGGRSAPDPAATAARSAEVQLSKGKSYALKVEFFHTAITGGRGRGGFGGFGTALPNLAWQPGVNLENTASAVEAAKGADVVIAVVGITRDLEGEEMNSARLPEGFDRGDRTSLDLPKDEQALLEAMKATGKPLVVVLTNGSAMGINWARQNANAIVEAWYPGEEGGTATADVLAGTYNPGGRLPLTFYKSVADLPPFDDYSMKGRTYRYFEGEPLFPFGFGLSYTSFAYSNAKVATPVVKAGGSLQVDVDVRNSGKAGGEEVAQAYLMFPKVAGAPLRALRGFERVEMAAGRTRHLRFTLDARDLSCVNEAGERLVAPGAYRLFIGGGQPGTGAPGVEVQFNIEGEQKLPR
ncbi:MAG TPA: glycoside hydrolase family 3 C-terminal domain-containing protein [Bryobacteraceae bacterium]|jgi:beta-glucosidase